MSRTLAASACSLLSILFCSAQEKAANPSFNYRVTQSHEIKPHRRTIPMNGVRTGFNQLHLSLTVSPTGEVLATSPRGNDATLKFWPQLQAEVKQWKFTPFEKDGKAVTADVEEYIDLVPPERQPVNHVIAPVLRPNSRVVITLARSSCFGSCPAYTVTVSTDGIVFEGQSSVVATGKRTDNVAPDEVRKLAKRFIDADFYSMDDKYQAAVTDMPTNIVSISIDGRKKEIVDYVGQWIGMPAIIRDLEDEVDTFARTERWIRASVGRFQHDLRVESLKVEFLARMPGQAFIRRAG